MTPSQLDNMLSDQNIAVTDLLHAREAVNSLFTTNIHDLRRLADQLERNQDRFNHLETPNPADTGNIKWTQEDCLNEAINHIENWLRNVNFRDWARRQAALAVAQAKVDRIKRDKVLASEVGAEV